VARRCLREYATSGGGPRGDLPAPQRHGDGRAIHNDGRTIGSGVHCVEPARRAPEARRRSRAGPDAEEETLSLLAAASIYRTCVRNPVLPACPPALPPPAPPLPITIT